MEQLRNKLAWSKKQTSYAWGKYYESQSENQGVHINHFEYLTQVVERDTTPQFVIDELKDLMIQLKKEIECPVCLSVIQPENIGFTKCGHKYCKECLEQLKLTTKKCAMCNRKIA
mgnify:FL=1